MKFTTPARFLLLLTAHCCADLVPVPVGAGVNAAIEVNGPLTTVHLGGPARLEWLDFNLDAGRELHFVSQNGAAFPSLNLLRSPAPSVIDGRIAADGPLYIISPGGLQVGTTARIEAPRVLLATMLPANEPQLLADGSGSFAPDVFGGSIGVDGSIETSAGPLVILSGTVFTGREARLRAPGSDVRISAADSAPVQAGLAGAPLIAPSSGGAGLVNTTGWIEARRVEIISDGFLVNGGRITALGQGNSVRLASSDVVHESRPDNSSVILTTSLTVDGPFRQVGSILRPNDGANPAVAAGLRQTPRLSTRGFITKLEPGQTQISNAPLQTVQNTASAIPRPLKPAQTVAVRRRGPATVKKAAFFGQQVRH